MRRKLIIIILLMIFCVAAKGNVNNSILTKQLQEKLLTSSENEFIRINIVLKEQYSTTCLASEVQYLSKDERREYVTSTLKIFSSFTQKDIINQLDYFKKSKAVKNIRSLWIANFINCLAVPNAIDELAKRDDIARIDYDKSQKITLPTDYIDDTKKPEYYSPQEIAWHVTKVNADDVWAQGYTGDEIIIAIIDTGVNYNHTDLADHLWTHPDYPNHGYDFYDEDYDPMDYRGHGTNCAGIAAGDGTSGTQTGIAPDAQIMCLKLASYGSDPEIFQSCQLAAIQFAVEYGANVLSMSYGWSIDYNPDRETWRNVMDNVLTAGVIAAAAAGNHGTGSDSWLPIPHNVITPADCPPPWRHPDQILTGGISSVVCIGNVDENDIISIHSSRGPVTWESVSGFNDYPYDPEIGLIKPDIVAPGKMITTLDWPGNTGYTIASGTSMATPCVAGVMALMLSKNNSLLPAEIDQIIEENALHLTETKSCTYGSGRIDALASINAIPATDIDNDLIQQKGLPFLYRNYPNPFNQKTVIKYAVPKASDVRLNIYNILGRKVAVLVDEHKEAGYHTAVWNVNEVSSGMYFYRLESDGYAKTKKMLLLK